MERSPERSTALADPLSDGAASGKAREHGEAKPAAMAGDAGGAAVKAARDPPGPLRLVANRTTDLPITGTSAPSEVPLGAATRAYAGLHHGKNQARRDERDGPGTWPPRPGHLGHKGLVHPPWWRLAVAWYSRCKHGPSLATAAIFPCCHARQPRRTRGHWLSRLLHRDPAHQWRPAGRGRHRAPWCSRPTTARPSPRAACSRATS